MDEDILWIRPEPATDRYVLVRDFRVVTSIHTVWVPEGFPYDGASIPAAVWTIAYTPFSPIVMAAAAAHDWLYHTHAVERGDADRILREILLRDGVSSELARSMYLAVRLVGGNYWDNNDEDLALLNALWARHKDRPDVAKFEFPPL